MTSARNLANLLSGGATTIERTDIANGAITTAKLKDGIITTSNISGNIDISAKLTGAVPIANGGTGLTTLTATNTSAIATSHITATSNKVNVTAGTQLKYKVEFANQSTSKDTRIQGISMIF